VSILSVPGANFESLAGGPDNVDLDAGGNSLHPFMLYACDTAGKKIIRFDPTASTITPQTVYSSSIEPECGRFTATGDFFFTNKNGGGIYQLVATIGLSTVPVAEIPFNNTSIRATSMPVDSSATMTGRGITQKYQGDLLAKANPSLGTYELTRMGHTGCLLTENSTVHRPRAIRSSLTFPTLLM
jgi:hypothetical protein